MPETNRMQKLATVDALDLWQSTQYAYCPDCYWVQCYNDVPDKACVWCGCQCVPYDPDRDVGNRERYLRAWGKR